MAGIDEFFFLFCEPRDFCDGGARNLVISTKATGVFAGCSLVPEMIRRTRVRINSIQNASYHRPLVKLYLLRIRRSGISQIGERDSPGDCFIDCAAAGDDNASASDTIITTKATWPLRSLSQVNESLRPVTVNDKIAAD